MNNNDTSTNAAFTKKKPGKSENVR